MRTIAPVLLAAAGATAQVYYVDGFNSGTNPSGWTFGAPVEVVEPTGGASNGYLHGSGLDTTIPFLRTGIPSVFTGAYRERFIHSLSLDLKVLSTDFPISGFHPAVILVS